MKSRGLTCRPEGSGLATQGSHLRTPRSLPPVPSSPHNPHPWSRRRCSLRRQIRRKSCPRLWSVAKIRMRRRSPPPCTNLLRPGSRARCGPRTGLGPSSPCQVSLRHTPGPAEIIRTGARLANPDAAECIEGREQRLPAFLPPLASGDGVAVVYDHEFCEESTAQAGQYVTADADDEIRPRRSLGEPASMR